MHALNLSTFHYYYDTTFLLYNVPIIIYFGANYVTLLVKSPTSLSIVIVQPRYLHSITTKKSDEKKWWAKKSDHHHTREQNNETFLLLRNVIFVWLKNM